MSLWGEAPWLWCTETLTVGTVMLSHSSCYISFPASHWVLSPLSPASLITGKWLCVQKGISLYIIPAHQPLSGTAIYGPHFSPCPIWSSEDLGSSIQQAKRSSRICTCYTHWLQKNLHLQYLMMICSKEFNDTAGHVMYVTLAVTENMPINSFRKRKLAYSSFHRPNKAFRCTANRTP